MKEAILYEKKADGKVRCHVCPWRCTIADGEAGHCCVRINRGGTLYAATYAKVSSVAADPIEKKPLFHFHPGTTALSLGSIGCNYRCIHCQNWGIAHVKPEGRDVPGVVDLPPGRAVESAVESGCAGVAWTYNEPTIWIEYTLESAELCRRKNLYTVYVTNGYTTTEALDAIGPHLDAYRVDVKGFTKEFYRRLAAAPSFAPVLDGAVRAKRRWGCHVEVVTNVIPGWNDDAEQLKALAAWIAEELGETTPWHVTRFIPHLELAQVPATPVETLERARRTGMDAGLKFVYVGNVPGHPGENTYCPQCGELAIERQGFTVVRYDVKGGRCSRCGDDLAIVEHKR